MLVADLVIRNDSGGTLKLKLSGLVSCIKGAGGGEDNFTFYPAINGVVDTTQGCTTATGTSDRRSVPIDAIISLDDTQYVEMWGENNDNTQDLIATYMSYTVIQIQG